MFFENIVESIGDIENCYKAGLQALEGNDSTKIRVQNTRKINGSVNLDACTVEKYPTDNRWDYIIGYKEMLFFVEIHPASTSNVSEVVKKVVWLKQWLKVKGTPLMTRIAKKEPYRWLQQVRWHLLKTANMPGFLLRIKFRFLRK